MAIAPGDEIVLCIVATERKGFRLTLLRAIGSTLLFWRCGQCEKTTSREAKYASVFGSIHAEFQRICRVYVFMYNDFN
jgi:hypothetical protein